MNRQMNQMSGGHRLNFTPKQGQYLAFIDAYTRINRRPPAEADIKRHFGVTPPSVHQMILTLERAGLTDPTRRTAQHRNPRPARAFAALLAHDQPVKTSAPRY